MRERQLLMSGRNVRAIFAGAKTVTRRPLREQPPAECGIHYMLGNESWLAPEKRAPLRHSWEAWHGPLFEKRPAKWLCGRFDAKCPYGVPGDRLWIRETWRERGYIGTDRDGVETEAEGYEYRADFDDEPPTGRWRPSIFMPRAACRLVVELADIQVERLQEIDEAGAGIEGASLFHAELAERAHSSGAEYTLPTQREIFRNGWDELNERRGFGWDADPWVWVLTFKKVDDAPR